MTVRWVLTFWNNSECNPHIFHFCQRVLPLFLLMTIASLTILGSSSPNLWVLLRYQALHLFTVKIFLSLFFKTQGTHQLKAGSWFMQWATAFSSMCIRCNSLRLGYFSHNVDPSFHLQLCPNQSFSQPLITSFLSSQLIAKPFFLWLMYACIKRYSFPSSIP